MMAAQGVISIHGREYWTVARRVADFRKTHPSTKGWAIETDIISVDAEVVIVKATIRDPDGKVVATGHAEEYRTASKINRTSAVENAETSAIGRAMAAAGWAGSGEYASADEMKKAERHDPKALVKSAGLNWQRFVDGVREAKKEADPLTMSPPDLEKAIQWFKNR
tara:strand:- start:2433 stop:2930 length:498 start_codon:yes stop_codon:yes gene_type:complete